MDKTVWVPAFLVAAAVGSFFAVNKVGQIDRDDIEAQARMNLQSLRESVAKDRAAKQPLEALQDPPVLWNTMFSDMPHEQGAGLMLVSARQPRDSGYWAYDRESGRVYIDCTHRDSRGTVWTSY